MYNAVIVSYANDSFSYNNDQIKCFIYFDI